MLRGARNLHKKSGKVAEFARSAGDSRFTIQRRAMPLSSTCANGIHVKPHRFAGVTIAIDGSLERNRKSGLHTAIVFFAISEHFTRGISTGGILAYSTIFAHAQRSLGMIAEPGSIGQRSWPGGLPPPAGTDRALPGGSGWFSTLGDSIPGVPAFLICISFEGIPAF